MLPKRSLNSETQASVSSQHNFTILKRRVGTSPLMPVPMQRSQDQQLPSIGGASHLHKVEIQGMCVGVESERFAGCVQLQRNNPVTPLQARDTQAVQ